MVHIRENTLEFELCHGLHDDRGVITAASVTNLFAFYVEQHNHHLPHSAFKGQTPVEMYFATGDGTPDKLQEQNLEARELRPESNRYELATSVSSQHPQPAEQAMQ